VGHYLGDGQSRQDRPSIGWSFGDKDENRHRIASYLDELGLKSWLWGKAGNGAIFTSSTHLHALMTSFGEKAHNKFIPEAAYSFSHEVVVAIIDGYFAADGHARKDRKNPEWRATSISYSLLCGIQRLCWQIGWSCSVHRQDYARKTIIEGREVNCRDSWGIAIKKHPHAQSRTKFMGDHVWRSVVSVESEEVWDFPVVDIEVEEDHTFCLAEGVIVHNCQGHSKARGKASGNPQHDASRSTAWAVVSAAEYHRPPAILVENVPEFLDWQLYRPWVLAMQALGYAVSPHVVDAADLGAPQNRIRMFLVLTQSAQPLKLNLPTLDHLPAASFIDFEAGRWQPIEKPGRAAATLERVRAGRATHGDRFLISYYGNTKTGRSLDRPIGTITTRDRWAIVDGDRMRMLSRWECRSAMSFPDTYQLPDNHRLAVHLLGNAVCPTPVSHIIKALQQAA
jgi:DNA (cytosine-5)-methyltransferase 1